MFVRRYSFIPCPDVPHWQARRSAGQHREVPVHSASPGTLSTCRRGFHGELCSAVWPNGCSLSDHGAHSWLADGRNGGSARLVPWEEQHEEESLAWLGADGARARLACCRRTEVQAGRRRPLHLVQLRRSEEGRPEGRDAVDLRSVAGRGRGAGPLRSRLFHRGDRRGDQLFVVGELRAADRHRHAGRQPAQHRRAAAARPAPGSRLRKAC